MFRSVLLGLRVANVLASIPQRAFSARETNDAQRTAAEDAFAGRTRPRNWSDATADPYFGIKSRGRRGAGERLALQQKAFATTARSKRKSENQRIGNPFTKKLRRDAFQASVDALRKLFPNARSSFIRAEAQSKARAIPVPAKPKKTKPDRKARVAVTYRAPTRAERDAAHRNKMAFKKQRRGR